MTPLTGCLLWLWLLSVVSFVWIKTYRWWRRRQRIVRLINQFPGPESTLPIIGNLHYLMGNPDTLLDRALAELFAKFHTKFRFWVCHIPAVVTADPNDLEVILGNQKHSSKPYYIYRLVECFFGRGLLVLNGDEWRAHRKAITPSFHFSVLERYSDIFLERADILCKRLVKFCGKPEFDVLPLVGTASNETICETAFGCRASGESGTDREAFIQDMESAFVIMQHRFIHPWLTSDLVFSFTEMGRKHRLADEHIREYATNAIRSRKLALATEIQATENTDDEGGTRQRYSFLDLMLKENNGLNEKDLLGEVRTLIAVQETSSTTLCFALLMLAMHPDIQDQVVEEVEEVWSRSDLTSHQKLQTLHLQDRVLKETLRLFPPVPILARELSHDAQLSDGRVIPGSSIVALWLFGIHRDPEVFPDPEKFDPDRFLPENCVGRHAYSYIPFSAGPRNCIGQKYGVLQMKAVLTCWIRRYKLLLPVGGPSKVSDIRLTVDTFLKQVGGTRIAIVER